MYKKKNKPRRVKNYVWFPRGIKNGDKLVLSIRGRHIKTEVVRVAYEPADAPGESILPILEAEYDLEGMHFHEIIKGREYKSIIKINGKTITEHNRLVKGGVIK